MSQSSADFRDTLMELVDASHPEPTDHPSEERWIAYQQGELPADESARLAEHLVRCRDCFDLVQAAAALFGPDEEPADDPSDLADPSVGSDIGGQDLASAALWRQLRPRLFPAPGRPSRAVRAPRSWTRFRMGVGVPATLAASLFLALVAMTGWNLQQRAELVALREPKPNAPIIDFSAAERASTTDETTLKAGSWMFVFHPPGDLAAYRLVIRDVGTGRVRSSHLLRPDADFALTLQLPEGLPAGRYRLEITDGAGGSAGKVLQERLLRVTAASRGE